jgi:hypothetical protein
VDRAVKMEGPSRACRSHGGRVGLRPRPTPPPDPQRRAACVQCHQPSEGLLTFERGRVTRRPTARAGFASAERTPRNQPWPGAIRRCHPTPKPRPERRTRGLRCRQAERLLPARGHEQGTGPAVEGREPLPLHPARQLKGRRVVPFRLLGNLPAQRPRPHEHEWQLHAREPPGLDRILHALRLGQPAHEQHARGARGDCVRVEPVHESGDDAHAAGRHAGGDQFLAHVP